MYHPPSFKILVYGGEGDRPKRVTAKAAGLAICDASSSATVPALTGRHCWPYGDHGRRCSAVRANSKLDSRPGNLP
jgi:hypothetical protein